LLHPADTPGEKQRRHVYLIIEIDEKSNIRPPFIISIFPPYLSTT
jgi:hypothetical protein